MSKMSFILATVFLSAIGSLFLAKSSGVSDKEIDLDTGENLKLLEGKAKLLLKKSSEEVNSLR